MNDIYFGDFKNITFTYEILLKAYLKSYKKSSTIILRGMNF